MTGKLYLAPTILFIFIQGFFGVYGAAAPKEEVLKDPDKRFLSQRVMPHPESAFIEEGGQVKSPVIHSSLGIRSLTATSPQDHMAISVLEEDQLPAGHPKDVLPRQNARTLGRGIWTSEKCYAHTLGGESEGPEVPGEISTREDCYAFIKKEIGEEILDNLQVDKIQKIKENVFSHLPGNKKRYEEIFELSFNDVKNFFYSQNYVWPTFGQFDLIGVTLGSITSIGANLVGIFSSESALFNYGLMPIGGILIACVGCRIVYFTFQNASRIFSCNLPICYTKLCPSWGPNKIERKHLKVQTDLSLITAICEKAWDNPTDSRLPEEVAEEIQEEFKIFIKPEESLGKSFYEQTLENLCAFQKEICED